MLSVHTHILLPMDDTDADAQCEWAFIVQENKRTYRPVLPA